MLFCTLISSAAAIVTFAVSLAIIWPFEKRLAKRLDDTLSLGERVQTMIAFRSEETAMADLQREDTENRLREVKGKQLRSKRAWMNLIAPVLAIALLVAAFAVPLRTVEPQLPPQGEPEDDLWSLEEWQVIRMRSLIESVRASDMVESGKETVVSILEELLSSLEPVKSRAEMKTLVIDSMLRIDRVTNGINTFTSVIKELRGSSNAKVGELAEALGVPSDPIVESKYQALKAGFTKEGLNDDFVGFARELAIAVNAIGVAEDDALYLSLKGFSDNVSAFAQAGADIDDEAFASEVSALFESGAESISSALSQQGKNRSVTDSANRELMDIFDIEWSELPEELKAPDGEEAGTVDGEYEEKDDEELKSDSGGFGGGEVIYGSNDTIYDPDDAKHISYGEVIDKYDGKKTTELDERELSDEIREWIDDYFSGLYYSEEK